MSLPVGWLFADSRTAMIAYFRFHGDCWYLTQAHEIPEPAAPSAEPAAVTGAFGLSAEYPSCPACRADSFARCHCCHGFCGVTGPLSGFIDSLRSTDWV
jgi:hypothetical protein